jgi:hypothetical protein
MYLYNYASKHETFHEINLSQINIQYVCVLHDTIRFTLSELSSHKHCDGSKSELLEI